MTEDAKIRMMFDLEQHGVRNLRDVDRKAIAHVAWLLADRPELAGVWRDKLTEHVPA